MEKKDMLEILINHYCDGNKSRFALKVGVAAQTINTWMGRNTFDLELIYSKCENLSGDWLLSGGEGEIFRTASAISTSGSSMTMGVGSMVKHYDEGCRDGEPSPVVRTLSESVSTLTRELETSQEQKSRLIGIIERITSSKG